VKKAIIRFQYTERIKSELIIAANLLEEISELKNDELAGAEKLMSSFLHALQSEIRIAHSVLQMQNFKVAGDKVAKVTESVFSHEYAEATKRISEAISRVTTGGQQPIQLLEEKGLL
jgi:hypothetical protein